MTRLGKYEEWGEVTRWASVCKNERKLGSRGLPQPFLPRNYSDGTEGPPRPPMAQIVRAPLGLISRPTARLLLQFPLPAGLWYWHWGVFKMNQKCHSVENRPSGSAKRWVLGMGVLGLLVERDRA